MMFERRKRALLNLASLISLGVSVASCSLILGIHGDYTNDEVTSGAGGAGGQKGSGSLAGSDGDPTASGHGGTTTLTDGSAAVTGPGSSVATSSAKASSGASTSTGPSTSTASTSSGGTGCPMHSVDLLADDFTDAMKTYKLWMSDGSGTASIAPGTLTLDNGREFYSIEYYNIKNCEVSVMYKGTATANAHFNLKNSAGSTVAQIFVGTGYISFTPQDPISNCPYDPTKHKYWRFSADSDNLYIKTSGTGSDWTDMPCGVAGGVGKFALSTLGLTDGKVQVHLGVTTGTQALFGPVN